MADRPILARLAVRERLRPMWTTTLTSVAAHAAPVGLS